MPACPGQWGVSGVMKVHCPHCRDTAPPVLTAFERGQIRSVRDAYTRGYCNMSDVEILLAVIDRLTGGEGGSRG